MALPPDILRLARELIALRQAAEVEVREVAALCPNHPLSAFEAECIRTAFKGGADYGSKAAYQKGYEDGIKAEAARQLAKDVCDKQRLIQP